uniref:Uncharacterized protein n=1 Tax=Equus asinus asinus TaxID=83772 RepID=A0A8C4N7B7_EQUAS
MVLVPGCPVRGLLLGTQSLIHLPLPTLLGFPTSPVQPSVVDRVASLPLVSSTCDMVSAAYGSTKDSHPHVRTVCDAAEKGVKTLTAAAVSGAQPILSKLEPQSEWGSVIGSPRRGGGCRGLTPGPPHVSHFAQSSRWGKQIQ